MSWSSFRDRDGATRRAALGAGLLLVALTGGGCSNPNDATLSQNVADGFEPCNPAEIRYLAGKHNFQTAFRECGSNNFQHFAWSPDGTHLYFAFEMAHHVMDASAPDKKVTTVPTESPVGQAAWLSASRLAVPVGAATDGGPVRIAIFDVKGPSLLHQPVPDLSDLQEVQPGPEPSVVLFSARGDDAHRGVYRLDLDDGSVAPAFPWLETPVDTFTYTASQDAVAVAHEGTVTLYRGATGEELGTWSPALRGVLHPEGRWLALEHQGDAISIFYQRSWDELSEKARERELRRAKQFEDRLPAWYPKEVQPPTLSVVDLQDGERWMFTGFYGHRFQWYEPTPYYASFLLWGFEGKELNRNVVLGNLADRLRSVERGEEMMGLQRWPAPKAAAEPEPDVAAEPEPAAAARNTLDR